MCSQIYIKKGRTNAHTNSTSTLSNKVKLTMDKYNLDDT